MSQNSTEDQEIDLGQLFNKIKEFWIFLGDCLFDLILFVKKNLLLLILLSILGFGVGMFITKNNRIYEHKIIVSPNFGSTEYVYEKIDLINSKVKENDTVFFRTIGIKNHLDIQNIKIEPIMEVYQFIDQTPNNFEMLKLLTQGSQGEKINEIIKSEITSRNFSNHLISFSSKKAISRKEIIDPLLKYLNTSSYYNELMVLTQKNINNQLIINDSILVQLDKIINQFSENLLSLKKDNLIYYNDNNPIDEIIKQKISIVDKIAELKIDIFNSDVVVKEISVVRNSHGVSTSFASMKIIFPFILILLFIFLKIFISFYKKQTLKRNQL